MGLAGSSFQQNSMHLGADVADTVLAAIDFVNASRLVLPLSVDIHKYNTPAVQVARGTAHIFVIRSPSELAVSNVT